MKNPEFVSWLIGHGDSISTAERRERRIRTLQKLGINLEEPDMAQIYKYLETRLRTGLKKKSLRLEMYDLQHWYRFKGMEIKLPIMKKEPDPDPFIPTEDEIQRMRLFCQSRNDKYTWKRNQLIIDLLVSTGMRAGELIRVNLEDIKAGPRLYVRSEKGEKDRLVPLPDKVSAEVEEYIKNYRYKSDPKALITTRTGRYKYTKLRALGKSVGRKSGVPAGHPQCFRHYYATALIKLGVDVRRVQILLGHARIDTTTRYTHLSQKEVGEEVKSAVEELFKFNRQKTKQVQIHVGAGHEVVGALGFEPRSTGLFRFIVPVTHHKSGDP